MKRKRGARSDNRVQVTYVDGVKENGTPNKKFFYGKTLTEAEGKRNRYIQEKRDGLDHSASTLTVNEWLDDWIRIYKIDKDEYAQYIGRMRNDFGFRSVQSIREADLIKSLSHYAGMSASAATKYRMILKRFFKSAMRNRYINFDPAEELQLPDNVTAGTHRALTSQETELILKHWSVHHAGTWAMVMLLCGLRRGEMVALDWDCVDLKNRRLTVKRAAEIRGSSVTIRNQTKTDAGMRTLPICEALNECLQKSPIKKGPVCLSAKGTRLTEAAIRKGWKTFCESIERVANGYPASVQGKREIPDDLPIRFSCRPHDLRHTYATALYDAGVDIKSAMYYLGHDDITMTQSLYTHLSEERENAARSSLVEYLDSWLPDEK